MFLATLFMAHNQKYYFVKAFYEIEAFTSDRPDLGKSDTHKKSVFFSGRTTKGVGRVNPPNH